MADEIRPWTVEPENNSVGTLGDTAKAAASGVFSSVLAPMASAAQYAFEQGQSKNGAAISSAIRSLSDKIGEDIADTMNPKSKELLAAGVTSEEFWAHPLLSLQLKSANMVPTMAALAIPGGMMATAIRASAVAAGGGAVLNAGAVIDEFYKKLDAASDEELAKESPYYNTLLESFGPEEARRRFAVKMQGMSPAINAVLGAAAGAVGPAGAAARALTGAPGAVIGAAGRGPLVAAGIGAAEGAAANALQEGVADVTAQRDAIDAGFQKEFDAARAADATLTGGAMGGIFGAAVGAATGKRAAKSKPLDAVTEATTTNAPVPQPKEGTTGNPAKPVENIAVGNPQNEPTRGSRGGAKVKTVSEPTQVVAPSGPDAAQAAAIAANEGAPVVAPTEVAAANERLQTPPVPEQVTEQPAQAAAPPNVAEAQQRLTADGAPVDTGANVPETPATLQAQQDQVASGDRKAVMYPSGTEVPRIPAGMKQIATPRGVFHYDPKQINPARIKALSAAGKENEILGLGPVSKTEAVARAAAGENPVAVVERTPDGTEVRAAAGTDPTAPAQLAAIEAVKSPGNTVAVEAPGAVVAARAEPVRTGRILKDLRQIDETAKIDVKKNLKGSELDEQGNKVVKGKNRTVKEKEAVEKSRATAEKIVSDHPPTDAESGYLSGGEAKAAVIERARKMVAAAEAEGVKIPTQIKVSAQGDAVSDSAAIQKLRYAKDLVQAVKSKATGAKSSKAVERFKEREQANPEEALAARRAEGDEAKRIDQGNVEERASAEVSKEDVLSEASAGKPDTEKNQVVTKAAPSSRGPLRNVDDGAEKRTVKTKEGAQVEVEGAKAASGDKLAADPEAKARMIAEMNAKLAAPKAPPTAHLLVKNAAKEVERNPTEAQIKAENYKKGHVKIHGLDITLENPRGGMRRGVGEDGKPWAVKMPDHYGYIKKTTGADGDHIDAYVGPNPKSERVFVVDQMGTRTGNFDEHKVMLGYNDEAQALDSYKRAFSDGLGEARAGNISEMSIAEFKEWLKTDTTKPATQHALEPGLDQSTMEVPYYQTGVKRTSMLTEPASKVISNLDLSHLSGVPLKLAEFIKGRMARLMGDTPVHFADPQDLADMTGRGVGDARGFAQKLPDGTTEIFIDANEAKNPATIAHVVLHEGMHIAVQDAIESSPNTKRVIRSMMNQTAEALANEPGVYDRFKYAFTNEHEFMSEAFSNPGFQEVLASIKINDKLSNYLQLDTTSPLSMWDRVVAQVRNIIEKVVGPLPHSHQMIAGVMRVGENMFNMRHEDLRLQALSKTSAADFAPENARFLMREAADAVKNFIERPENQTAENAPRLMKLRTFDNIAQMAKHFWGGENNPVRKIHEAVEKMRVTGDRIFRGSEPIIKELVELRAKHNGETWDKFVKVLHDATMANVHPDVPLNDPKNAYLGKDALTGKQAKYRHAELAREFDALPDDLKAAFAKTTKHFADTQNKMSLGVINNQILHLMGIKDEALGQRIHEGTLTDADRTRLGDMLPDIEAASELSKIEGPYVPLMRRGDFVVRGTYKVDTPPGAKRISENVIEFDTRKEAVAYGEAHELSSKIKSVWVDGKTGELHAVDPSTGETVKILKQDTSSVNKFRVQLQDQHVEFHKTKKEAEARARELKEELGDKIDLKGVVPRQYEPDGRGGVDLSGSLGRLAKKLEKTPAYQEATQAQKVAMRRTLEEASISALGSTRIQSKSLPRRNVKGYSHDIVQNTYDYGLSSSRYLAKLEHAPELEAGMKEMLATIDQDASKNLSYGRQAIANEVQERVRGDNGFEQGGDTFSQVTKRLLAISFIDKLGSPAYTVINLTQPGMVTMPYLSGRHGVGRSFSALGKAYSDISSLQILKQGAVETARRLKGSGKPDDFISMAKANLENADERAMLEKHVEIGTIDPNAGMEIASMVRDTSGVGGKLDSAIGYLEGVTREMPRAAEAINRMATALASYRLERGRGATHEKALAYSIDAVNNTQFNYNPTNAPKLFNHPVAKIALQFKKYGQGMYQLIGMNIGKAMRNAEPGERAEALKTLAGIAGTHMAMAGALGLPTEPFKYLILGANAAGLTGLTWSDVENKIREGAAGTFGKTFGEVLTRGLPRLANLDLGRMGLDSVTSFGEPHSQKEADVKTWLFDSLAGPVVSLGGDWVKGVQSAGNGDFAKAAEKLIPIKAASDAIRAYRQTTEGKKSISGRETMSAYSPSEAALRVLGFGNAREAEIGAKRSAYYAGSQRLKEERGDLVKAWTEAKPADKVKAFAAITAWNKDVPKDTQIRMKELTDKLKRDEKTKKGLVNGIKPGKKDKYLLDRGEATYNAQ